MADLVTHLATVLIPAAFVRHRVVPVVGFGAVLPDLASRVPGEALEQLHLRGLPIPEQAVMPWGVTHEPVPLLALCGLLALGFRPRDRGTVFLGLLGGCAAHLGLDVLQDHHGHGYALLFPFSTQPFELGLLHSEATVVWAPWLGLLTALLWAWRWRQGVRTASGNSPGSGPGPSP